MKVKELVRILKTLDQDKPIYMSSDSEGNSFSNPCEISEEGDCYVLWPDDCYVDADEEIWNEN
jgi:hypothetical protein